jgi:type IV secretory pathway component VirB8
MNYASECLYQYQQERFSNDFYAANPNGFFCSDYRFHKYTVVYLVHVLDRCQTFGQRRGYYQRW